MRHLAVHVLTLAISFSVAHQRLAPPPVLGTWQYIGTAPPGFVRHGVEVARFTLTIRSGRLRGLVLTGPHRYAATGQYSAAHHELQLIVHTSRGTVRWQAWLQSGNQRMSGIWYDAHGDDGGFALLRATGTEGTHEAVCALAHPRDQHCSPATF